MRRISVDSGTKELIEARKQMEKAGADEWFKKLTGREVYEAPSVSLTAHTIVDRPVKLALNGTTFTPDISIDPVLTMIDCLVDGKVVIRLGPGWDDLTIEPHEHIHTVKNDGKGFVEALRIQYVIEDKKEKGRTLIYRRDYIKIPEKDEMGRIIGEHSFVLNYPLFKTEEAADKGVPNRITPIEFIPFVAIEWIRQISFLYDLRKALLRTEGVQDEISTENRRHSTRKLMMKLPTNTDIQVTELNEQINKLPVDGDAFYPDPHSAGMESIFKEKENIVTNIENATGVIAAEKMNFLSGVSRMWAMKSLTDFAKDIRKRFTDGMITIETIFKQADFRSEKIQIIYQPIAMPVTDVTNQYNILREAREDGVIDLIEYRESVRQMLSL